MVQWLRLSASNVGVQVQKEREREGGEASPKGRANLKENTCSFLRTWSVPGLQVRCRMDG